MPHARLVDRRPDLDTGALIAGMVPPPRFDAVRFDTYLPAADEPSQAVALDACRAFAGRLAADHPTGLRARLRAVRQGHRTFGPPPGLYLDGGFGVGKTHLLASIWHASPAPKAYCTFTELTSLVGAMGFTEAVRGLAAYRLLAIDEFELDDPGDTMLVTRLLTEVTQCGVQVAATSNTLPEALGEGRFAAEDFLREIQTLAARFATVRIDGPDYRHRGLPDAPEPFSDADLLARAEAIAGSTVDDFDALCRHLTAVHPSRYGRLVDGVSAVFLRGVHGAPDQSVALRLVALADRLYDRSVPVAVSGESLSVLFDAEMLAGGYRKKYLRALSRLVALSRGVPDPPDMLLGPWGMRSATSASTNTTPTENPAPPTTSVG